MPPSAAQPGGPARARGGRAARAGQGPGATRFADADEFIAALEARASPRPDGSAARRGRARRCRAPARRRLEPSARSAARRRWPAAWLLGAAARSPRWASARYLLLGAARRSRCPTWSARRSRRAAQTLQNQRLRGRHRSASSAPRCRGPRRSTQDPAAAATQADEGSTVTLIVSGGPGQATVPAGHGHDAGRGARRRSRAAGFKVVDARRPYSDDRRRASVIDTSPPERHAARARAAR